jgi:hypothetical protein
LPALVGPPGAEAEAQAAMNQVLADPEVIASINTRREAYFASHPKRRLWPC